MDTMHTVLSVLQVLACLFLIITILLQEGSSQGVSGVVSGGTETFFGSKKPRGIQAVLSRATTIVAVLFGIFAVALNLL